MNNFKTIASLITTFFVTSILFALPLIDPKNLFTANESRIALTGEFLTSVVLKGKGNVFSPGVEMLSPVVNSYINVNPSDYDMTAVEKGFFAMEGNNWNRQKIYKSLSDFSALKGMNYHSQTKGGNSILILESYRIKSQNDYSTENQNEKNIPASSISHFLIKDNRLGNLSFKSEFFTSGDNFISINTLTERASKYGMDIFYPGDYKIFKILIYDKKIKGYYFYTAQFMRVRSSILNKIDLIKPESFGNRVRAENIHFLKSLGVDRSWKLAAFK